jgi:hypothetical protein
MKTNNKKKAFALSIFASYKAMMAFAKQNLGDSLVTLWLHYTSEKRRNYKTCKQSPKKIVVKLTIYLTTFCQIPKNALSKRWN